MVCWSIDLFSRLGLRCIERKKTRKFHIWNAHNGRSIISSFTVKDPSGKDTPLIILPAPCSLVAAIELCNQKRSHLSLNIKTTDYVHIQKIPATWGDRELFKTCQLISGQFIYLLKYFFVRHIVMFCLFKLSLKHDIR